MYAKEDYAGFKILDIFEVELKIIDTRMNPMLAAFEA